ncbi:MAG: hypothetical protein AB1921_05045 [Thermodesulfobacteriota bacterium]
MDRMRVLKIYLWTAGIFCLFYWPVSHWFYPEWYHRLMGFTSYEDSFVKIIGTLSLLPVAGIFALALRPLQNRDLAALLTVFAVLMAGTYVFVILFRGFPAREWFNVALLFGNAAGLCVLYPWREAFRQ